MAVCFPLMRYVYLLVIFTISFILITGPKKMEMLGLGLFFAVNTMFSVSLGGDILKFMQLPKRQTWMTGLSTISIIIGLLFNFVSSIMVIVALNKLNAEFNAKGTKLSLYPESRKDLDLFESMIISSVVLIAVVSLNVYFNAEKLSNSASVLFDNLTTRTSHPLYHLFFILVVITIWGLHAKISDIMVGKLTEEPAGVKLKHKKEIDKNLLPFSNYFGILTGLLVPLLFLELAKVWIHYVGIYHFDWLMSNSVGIDMVFDMLKWGFTLSSVVISGLLIEKFDQIPDVENVYWKDRFRPVFISFMFFLFYVYMSILSNTSYFIDFLLLIIKLFAPLAVIALSSYLIYLGYKLSRLSRHQLAE